MKDKILEGINSPLGFFVLSLMVVESFLALVLTQSTLTEMHQFIGLLIGVTLFVIVIFVVSLFVWKKPEHLIFNSTSRLIYDGKIRYGDNTGMAPAIEVQTVDLSQQPMPAVPPPPPASSQVQPPPLPPC